MSDDLFTRSLPEVTFEYLRKTVRRGRDDGDADEQREHQESRRDEDRVSPVAFDALDEIMYEDQSSATIREY